MREKKKFDYARDLLHESFLQHIIMKLEDLYLINKEQWLDVIKDKCKKRTKTHFWVGLVLLILFLIMVTITIYFGHSTPYLAYHDKVSFVSLLLALFFCALLSGWWVLKSHSFLKTIGGLGTPEQLLTKFKKYIKDESIILTLLSVIFCGWFACFVSSSDLGIIGKVMLWILLLAVITVRISTLMLDKYFLASSDEDITRRLQELIGEE